MNLVDYVVLSEDPSLHQVKRQLRQENQLMSLEQPPADPGEDGHAQRVAEVQDPCVDRLRRLGLGDGLDEERDERVQRVLVHVVDETPVPTRDVHKTQRREHELSCDFGKLRRLSRREVLINAAGGNTNQTTTFGQKLSCTHLLKIITNIIYANPAGVSL